MSKTMKKNMEMSASKLAAEDFQRAKEELLKNGCRVAKTFGEKSVLLDDPYGLKFHLFESV